MPIHAELRHGVSNSSIGRPKFDTAGQGAGPETGMKFGFLHMWKTVTAITFFSTAASASALPPLHENPTVLNGFYSIGLADIVRKRCPTIEPRIFRAIGYLRSLERYALTQGYTEADIDELSDNKEEKKRLRAQIVADLAKRGATPETPEGYCTVGLEEIAKGSAAGRLLKAK